NLEYPRRGSNFLMRNGLRIGPINPENRLLFRVISFHERADKLERAVFWRNLIPHKDNAKGSCNVWPHSCLAKRGTVQDTCHVEGSEDPAASLEQSFRQPEQPARMNNKRDLPLGFRPFTSAPQERQVVIGIWQIKRTRFRA